MTRLGLVFIESKCISEKSPLWKVFWSHYSVDP